MEQPLFLCQQHSTAMRPPAAAPAAAVAAPAAAVAAHTPVVQHCPWRRHTRALL